MTSLITPAQTTISFKPRGASRNHAMNSSRNWRKSPVVATSRRCSIKDLKENLISCRAARHLFSGNMETEQGRVAAAALLQCVRSGHPFLKTGYPLNASTHNPLCILIQERITTRFAQGTKTRRIPHPSRPGRMCRYFYSGVPE